MLPCSDRFALLTGCKPLISCEALAALHVAEFSGHFPILYQLHWCPRCRATLGRAKPMLCSKAAAGLFSNKRMWLPGALRGRCKAQDQAQQRGQSRLRSRQRRARQRRRRLVAGQQRGRQPEQRHPVRRRQRHVQRDQHHHPPVQSRPHHWCASPWSQGQGLQCTWHWTTQPSRHRARHNA